jgi:uncharacterized protein
MKLDLNEIAAHIGTRMKYTIDEPAIEDVVSALRCVQPVTGEVTFTNAGSTVVARGHFRTAVELECSRCLGSYTLEVESEIDEGLPLIDRGPESAPDTEEEELPEDEKEPLFVDNIYDLEELLRQSILVSIPIKPLCSDQCKGLCPRCGRNLNEGPCGCSPDEGQGSFAELAALIEGQEEPK